jgi:hypothetical protein
MDFFSLVIYTLQGMAKLLIWSGSGVLLDKTKILGQTERKTISKANASL